MIRFSPEIPFWSAFVFWYVFVNAFACLGFLVVVAVGGLFDVRYLLRALDEQKADETDDGRVVEPPPEKEG